MTNPNLDAKDMFKNLDISGDGEVDFDEFLEAMKTL